MELDQEMLKLLNDISIDFHTKLIKAQNEHSEKYKKNEGDSLFSFRFLLDATISKIAYQFTNKIESINEKQSYQLCISLSMIRSHFIISDLLLKGEIIDANVLIRKQLENLARLHEVDNNPLDKLLRKTPNVCNTLHRFGKKMYPDLSEVAHYGTPRVSNLMGYTAVEDGRSGPFLFPNYSDQSKESFKNYGGIMVLFINWIVDYIKKMYGEGHVFEELYDLLLKKLFEKAVEIEVLKIVE